MSGSMEHCIMALRQSTISLLTCIMAPPTRNILLGLALRVALISSIETFSHSMESTLVKLWALRMVTLPMVCPGKWPVCISFSVAVLLTDQGRVLYIGSPILMILVSLLKWLGMTRY